MYLIIPWRGGRVYKCIYRSVITNVTYTWTTLSDSIDLYDMMEVSNEEHIPTFIYIPTPAITSLHHIIFAICSRDKNLRTQIKNLPINFWSNIQPPVLLLLSSSSYNLITQTQFLRIKDSASLLLLYMIFIPRSIHHNLPHLYSSSIYPNPLPTLALAQETFSEEPCHMI